MIRAGLDLLRELLIIHRDRDVHSVQLIELQGKSIDTVMVEDYKGWCIGIHRWFGR